MPRFPLNLQTRLRACGIGLSVLALLVLVQSLSAEARIEVLWDRARYGFTLLLGIATIAASRRQPTRLASIMLIGGCVLGIVGFSYYWLDWVVEPLPGWRYRFVFSLMATAGGLVGNLSLPIVWGSASTLREDPTIDVALRASRPGGIVALTALVLSLLGPMGWIIVMDVFFNTSEVFSWMGTLIRGLDGIATLAQGCACVEAIRLPSSSTEIAPRARLIHRLLWSSFVLIALRMILWICMSRDLSLYGRIVVSAFSVLIPLYLIATMTFHVQNHFQNGSSKNPLPGGPSSLAEAGR
jgi:hypothetical protein